MTVESIIRPIVEGKLRTFIQEHPSLLDCVVWYSKKETKKEDVFVNSAAKRIVNDVVSQETVERLRTALCGANPHREGVVDASAAAHHSAVGEGAGEAETTSLPRITAGDMDEMIEAGMKASRLAFTWATPEEKFRIALEAALAVKGKNEN